ncbi:MAG: hypothetical protein V5A20_13655 [Salinibacter sp.]|uniref:hypothetical protein n=1 Tax=Salinibacter sp. TaxID=2065818 RepID=UPI002FC2B32A
MRRDRRGATCRLRPDTYLAASMTDLGGVRRGADSQVLRPVRTQVTAEGVYLSDEWLTTVYDGDLGAYVNGEIARPLDSVYTTALPAAVHVGERRTVGHPLHRRSRARGRYTLGVDLRVSLPAPR